MTISNTNFSYTPDPIFTLENNEGKMNAGLLGIILVLIQILGIIAIIYYQASMFFKVMQLLTTNSIYTSREKETNQTISNQPTSDLSNFSELSYQVKLLWGKGDYKQSGQEADNLLKIASNSEEKAIAYYWKGLSIYKLGDLDTAEQYLNNATKENQKYAAPYVTLGAIASSRNQINKMKEFSIKCVELDSQYAWCHNNLGLSYMLSGEKEKGISELREAVRLDPQSYVFNDNLNRALKE